MGLINKIKKILGITAIEVQQVEARKEAEKRDERLYTLLERLTQPQQPTPMPPASGREAELINQIASLQAEVKRLKTLNDQQSKQAVEAFLASLSEKTAAGEGRVGRPRKDGTKVTLRIDTRSWAAVEYLRAVNPKWKFTEFCNEAVSSRLDELFEEEPRLEAGFNLWMQQRLEDSDSEDNPIS